MSELTREKVEHICKFLVEEHLSKDASMILAHDAALRAKVEAQRTRIEQLEKELEEYRGIAEKIGAEKAISQLATLSALREVVEGLTLLSQQDPLRSHPLWDEWVNGPDYRTKSFKQRLAKRLLAQLAEIPPQDAGAKEA